MGSVRVVKAADHPSLAWGEVPRPEGDEAPPGEEVAAFRSADNQFVTGFWRRVPEEGRMRLDDYHEVALILEGEVEVIEDDGTVHRIGPGDLLITPRGTQATWRSLSPVKKLWAIYKAD
jgi:uncharacterized cupin superfamily protein